MIKVIASDDSCFIVNKQILVKCSYFKDLIENCSDIEQIELPYPHPSVSNLLDYLNGVNFKFNLNDLELADALDFNDYLIYLLKQIPNNLELLIRYHCTHHFVDDVVELLLSQSILIDYANYMFGRDSLFDQIFKSMFNQHLIMFLKKFPLNGSSKARTALYLKIIQDAYDKLSDNMIEHLSTDSNDYRWPTLFNIYRTMPRSNLKKFFKTILGNLTRMKGIKLVIDV